MQKVVSKATIGESFTWLAHFIWKWHQLIQPHPLNHFVHKQKWMQNVPNDSYWFKTSYRLTFAIYNDLLKLTLSSKHSFGNILRKFDGNWTFLMDSVCLLSSMPEIGIFHAVFQMIHHGQNCEFCHIESRGKNTVKSLINLHSTSFFVHIELIYIVFISAC